MNKVYLFTLPILGKKYKVYKVDRTQMTEEAGICFPEDGVIFLRDDKPDSMIRTLIHETVHATAHRSGWTQSISTELEEVICESISTVMFENIDIIFPPTK